MRAHIAVHILRQELLSPNTCGFCGRDICTITLKVTSRKGTKRIYSIDNWDCDYFFEYGRSKKFSKRSNHCTNHIDRCPIAGCLTNVWKYNFIGHLKEKHPNIEESEFSDIMVSEEEKKYLLK